MPKARNDVTTPPIGGLDKPLYVLRMNWWHWSDANRLKWLRVLKSELTRTLANVEVWIARLEPPRRLCGLDHHKGVACPNEKKGCTW